jgi:hypothetical protein
MQTPRASRVLRRANEANGQPTSARRRSPHPILCKPHRTLCPRQHVQTLFWTAIPVNLMPQAAISLRGRRRNRGPSDSVISPAVGYDKGGPNHLARLGQKGLSLQTNIQSHHYRLRTWGRTRTSHTTWHTRRTSRCLLLENQLEQWRAWREIIRNEHLLKERCCLPRLGVMAVDGRQHEKT